MELIKKHAQKIRFGIVGIANTALDFILLFLFVGLGVDKIVANYFSTSIAFIFSFFVNKKFTFKNTDGNVKRQFALFILVTIIGLWVIQPLVIAAVTSIPVDASWPKEGILFIAKVIATVASLIWNYLFYSRLVFKKGTTSDENSN
jgi:putative flippase GtrA